VLLKAAELPVNDLNTIVVITTQDHNRQTSVCVSKDTLHSSDKTDDCSPSWLQQGIHSNCHQAKKQV